MPPAVLVNLVTGPTLGARSRLLSELIQGPFAGETVLVVVSELEQDALPPRLAGSHGCWSLGGGCFCCEGIQRFAELLDGLSRRQDLRRILVSVPGQAEPMNLHRAVFALQNAGSGLSLEPTVCALDPREVAALEGTPDHHQHAHFKSSDVIILLDDPGVHPENLTKITDLVLAANPRAWTLTLADGLAQVDYLMRGDLGPGRPVDPPRGYVSFSFHNTAARLRRDRLEQLLRRLPKELFRIRGRVRTDEGAFRLNYITGLYDMEPVDDGGPSYLTIVGRDLNPERLVGQLNRCLEPPD